MSRWQYTKGLHDIGNGCYAYLQPDGGWGYSNAGLVVDKGESLLIDTLIDLPLTREMLSTMAAATPAARRIGTVLNTHAHPDHTGGNPLVADAMIIASEATAKEMREIEAGPMKQQILRWQEFGEAGAFLHEVMGSRFELHREATVFPKKTFDREFTLYIGAKEVRLLNVGPAHTKGDTLTYLPAERTVYTGDIVFYEVHPLATSGSIQAWIAACDRILGWQVETVVPGHGPITDKSGVRRLKQYFEYLRTEARKRFDAGMRFDEAARDIAWDAFRGWADDERIYANVNAMYRDFGGTAESFPNILAIARAHRNKRRLGAKLEGR